MSAERTPSRQCWDALIPRRFGQCVAAKLSKPSDIPFSLSLSQ